MSSARYARLLFSSFVFTLADISPSPKLYHWQKKEQNAASAERKVVKEKATAPPSGGGGYMGQIADARARLAQAIAEEDQVHVKLDMSRCELGELEIWSRRWNGRHAG